MFYSDGFPPLGRSIIDIQIFMCVMHKGLLSTLDLAHRPWKGLSRPNIHSTGGLMSRAPDLCINYEELGDEEEGSWRLQAIFKSE